MQGLGPNELLVPSLLHLDYITANPFSVSHPTLILSQTPLASSHEELFKLVSRSFSALNFSQPNFTKDCCFCLSSNLPFYEAIASNGTIWIASDQVACWWSQSHERVALLYIVGTVLCTGQLLRDYSHFFAIHRVFNDTIWCHQKISVGLVTVALLPISLNFLKTMIFVF